MRMRDYAYDVFVSYRWVDPDKTWVREQLAPALRSAGLRVCLDVEDFVPGRDLILEMSRAGQESRHALCILSPDYFEGNTMVGFESLMARRIDPSGMDSGLVPLIFRDADRPDWLSSLVSVDWTEPKNHMREWRKLLRVLGAQTLDAAPPSTVTVQEGIRPAVSASPKIIGVLSIAKNSHLRLERTTLEGQIEKAQDQSKFPKQVLNVYPRRLQEGLRWDHIDSEGWDFKVDLDGSVGFQMNIGEDATFMEDNSSGGSQPGTPEPGVSALWCLIVLIGIVRFWHALLENYRTEGELRLCLEGVAGKHLSFNGLDKHLNPRYPYPWDYSFWNHDGRQAQEDRIEVFRSVSSQITKQELADLAAELFAEIGFFFSFRVVGSFSHPMERIRDLACRLFD